MTTAADREQGEFHRAVIDRLRSERDGLHAVLSAIVASGLLTAEAEGEVRTLLDGMYVHA